MEALEGCGVCRREAEGLAAGYVRACEVGGRREAGYRRFLLGVVPVGEAVLAKVRRRVWLSEKALRAAGLEGRRERA